MDETVDMSGFYTDPWAGSYDTSMSNFDPGLFDTSSLLGDLSGVDFGGLLGDMTGGMDYSSLFGVQPDYTSMFPDTSSVDYGVNSYDPFGTNDTYNFDTGGYDAGPADMSSYVGDAANMASELDTGTPSDLHGGSSVFNSPLPEGDVANTLFKDANSEQSVIDYVSSRSDLSMDEKIALLQDMKQSLGYVEPGAYSPTSPVVSPDEQKTSVASTAGSQYALPKAPTGSSGGSSGGGSSSQPKQETKTPLQQGTANALSLLNMLAPLLTKGLKAPAGKDSKGTTGMSWVRPQNKAAGGRISNGPNKTSIGALGLLKAHTKGQDDVVPVAAAGGEYVMDADTVSALGDGNTAAGAKVLDGMRQEVRKHKRSAPADKIPPKAKSPLAYLAGAK
jgi:hypothetical protein